MRLRLGELASSKKPIQSEQVADFLCTVGEMLADMGTPDPCLDSHGKHFKTLSNPFRACGKEDPPPDRAKPVPIQLVEHAVNSLLADTTMPVHLWHAMADCIVIGCFFSLRPGECVHARGDDNHPFHLQDISIVTPNGTFNAAAATKAQLQAATAANLLFAMQKNGECSKSRCRPGTRAQRRCPIASQFCRAHHSSVLQTEDWLPLLPEAELWWW